MGSIRSNCKYSFAEVNQLSVVLLSTKIFSKTSVKSYFNVSYVFALHLSERLRNFRPKNLGAISNRPVREQNVCQRANMYNKESLLHILKSYKQLFTCHMAMPISVTNRCVRHLNSGSLPLNVR